jgi:hypothetical protein
VPTRRQKIRTKLLRMVQLKSTTSSTLSDSSPLHSTRNRTWLILRLSRQSSQLSRSRLLIRLMQGYMKAVKVQLQPDRVQAFENGAQAYAKKIVANFKDYEFVRLVRSKNHCTFSLCYILVYWRIYEPWWHDRTSELPGTWSYVCAVTSVISSGLHIQEDGVTRTLIEFPQQHSCLTIRHSIFHFLEGWPQRGEALIFCNASSVLCCYFVDLPPYMSVQIV